MPDVDRESAREQLVLAHLAAFGPARAADVAAWSGMRSVQVVLDRLAPQLVRVSDESGRVLYDLPDAPRPDPDVPAPPRLLGDWDTVLLGHAEHSRVVDAEVRRRLMTANGRLRQSFMVDGRVVGGWSVAQDGTSAVLSLEPYVRVPRRLRPPRRPPGLVDPRRHRPRRTRPHAPLTNGRLPAAAGTLWRSHREVAWVSGLGRRGSA